MTKCPEGCQCRRHSAQQSRRITVEQRRERDAAYMRKFRKEKSERDPEWAAQAKEKKRESNRLYHRKYNLKSKFGLSLEQWEAMLIEESGCCYLCGEPLAGVIHVDHDRSCCSGSKSCGRCVRGLAHQKCNQGIGQFGDDPERLRRVADALEAMNAKLASRRGNPNPGEQ